MCVKHADGPHHSEYSVYSVISGFPIYTARVYPDVVVFQLLLIYSVVDPVLGGIPFGIFSCTKNLASTFARLY